MNTPKVKYKQLSFWTEERKAEARHLYLDKDQSASTVGKHFGVSRNAVIGIINRMGLRKEKKPVVREPRTKPHKRARTAADRIKRQAEPPRPIPVHGEYLPPLLASVKELTSRTCAYPYGLSDFQFCGREKTYGAFCDIHGLICYNEPLAFRRR